MLPQEQQNWESGSSDWAIKTKSQLSYILFGMSRHLITTLALTKYWEIVLTISILPGLLDGPVCRLRDRHLKGGFKAQECIKGAHLARPSVLMLLYCLIPFNYRGRLMTTRERKARGARASSTTLLNQRTFSQARHVIAKGSRSLASGEREARGGRRKGVIYDFSQSENILAG